MKYPIPDAVVNQHIAVLGKTRSGKSSVMRGLVERLLDHGEPVCIIDPKGDWWGIKLGADGKRAGYPVVIFGGDHADVPISAHAGAHVAELFAIGNRPCLIDLRGWTVGDRTRFWIDFASTLFKQTRGRRWLVIDEVHNFAPKGKIFDPDAGKALHWANRLASEGLGIGLALVFASQRPQKVHNDLLTSAETLIAMRVLHPSDRDAVSDWIKGCGDPKLGGNVLNSLAQMNRGEGWAWSPEIGFGPERVKFPMFTTYDSFRPQTADDTKKLKGWAEVDLDEVKTKLASVVKEAEANDPKRLKAKIAELERQLAGKGDAIDESVLDSATLAAYERGKAQGYTDTIVAASKSIVPTMRALAVQFSESHERFRAQVAELADRLESQAERAPAVAKITPRAKPPAEPRRIIGVGRPAKTIEIPQRHAGNGTGEPMPGGERKVLTVLAQYPDGRSRRQLAILAGYAQSGGAFNNYLSAARSKGLMEGYGDGPLRITPLGYQALGSYEPLPTGNALREYWLAQLEKAPRHVLEVLCSAYPNSLSKERIAELANYEAGGGGFNNALSRLRTLGLAEGRGELRASDDLFGG